VFRLGYNTNGLAHHRLLDALRLLADLGYEGVAITPDVGQLDPLRPDPDLVGDVRRWSSELGLSLAIETGARFVLDARRKHFPTLVDPDPLQRERRIDFLRRSIRLARDLGADVVSLWAGSAPEGVFADRPEAASGDDPRVEEVWDRLTTGVRAALGCAREHGVQLAFEPEPDMFVERPAGYVELLARLGSDGDELGLCLDVGHLLCTGDVPVGDTIRRLGPRLAQVHLDDIRGGVHEHRMFGEGDLDLSEALRALLEAGYTGMAAVELSRDSHRGAQAAEQAMARIREAFDIASSGGV